MLCKHTARIGMGQNIDVYVVWNRTLYLALCTPLICNCWIYLHFFVYLFDFCFLINYKKKFTSNSPKT